MAMQRSVKAEISLDPLECVCFQHGTVLFRCNTIGQSIQPFLNNDTCKGEPRGVRVEQSTRCVHRCCRVRMRVIVEIACSMIMRQRGRSVRVKHLK